MTIILGANHFITKKNAEDFIRSLIKEVGITQSVLECDTNAHSIFMDLIKLHPKKDKVINTVDFMIEQDSLNRKALTLSIVDNKGKVDTISWLTCIKGKPDTNEQKHKIALRYAISQQIIDFRKQQTNECKMCGKITNEPHIDHIVHFAKLISDFEQEYPQPPNILYLDAPDGRYMFHPTNIEYENTWKQYHQQHAELRLVCKTCNLTRPNFSQESTTKQQEYLKTHCMTCGKQINQNGTHYKRCFICNRNYQGLFKCAKPQTK